MYGWNAGAISTETLTGNGYLEFNKGLNSAVIIGLSNGDTNQYWNDPDFAINIPGGNTYSVQEFGSNKGTFGSFTSSDIFRVEVVGTTIQYLKNGSVFYTSTNTPTFPLNIDTSLHTPGANITNVSIYQAPTPSASFNVSNPGCTLATGQSSCTMTVEWSSANAPNSGVFIDNNTNYWSGTPGVKQFPFTTISPRTLRVRLNRLDSNSQVLATTQVYATQGTTPAPFSAPVLGNPTGSITDTTPAFTWSAVTNASEYKLKVTNTATSALVINQNVTSTAYTPTNALALANYSWTVQAFNSTGNGPTSNAQTFQISTGTSSGINWINKVGVSTTSTSITKPTSGVYGWNAGAISTEALTGNGYLEFNKGLNSAVIIGLSNGDTNQYWNDPDFAINMPGGNTYSVQEFGSNKGTFGSFTSSDIFRIEVVGTTIQYLKNGNVFYTSTNTPTFPLNIDTSLHTPGASITNITIVEELVQALTVDINNLSGNFVDRIWTGANGGFTYAKFAETRLDNWPLNWLKDKFPFFDRIRFGNSLFGHCKIPSWAISLGYNLEEIYVWNPALNKFETNFSNFFLYMQRILDSGLNPHVALTGTPVNLIDRNIDLSTYDQSSDFNGNCGNFSHVAVVAPNEQTKKGGGPTSRDEWQNMVDELLSQSKVVFGNNEVQEWTWTTWTEPDVMGHYLGTQNEMIDLIKRSVVAANNNNIDLRIGNFVLGRDEFDFYLTNLNNQQQLNDLSGGIGLSVYMNHGSTNKPISSIRDIETYLDSLKQLLVSKGLSNFPIHIDELGLVSINDTSVSNVYSGTFGAAWLATTVKLFMDHNLNIETLTFWHRHMHKNSNRHPDNWIREPSYEVLNLFDKLKGLQRINVQGLNVNLDDPSHFRNGVAVYDSTNHEIKVLYIDFDETNSFSLSQNDEVFNFSSLIPNKVYCIEHSKIVDEINGNVLETVDYRCQNSSAAGIIDFTLSMNTNSVNWITIK